MKQKATNLRIECKTCGTSFGTVQSNLAKFNNEWDPDEPTGWVKQRLEANDLGVMTHLPIICTTCEPNKKIATLMLDFVSRENDAILTFDK